LMRSTLFRNRVWLPLAALVFLLVTGCRMSRVLFPEMSEPDQRWLKTESFHYMIYYRPESPAAHNIQSIAQELDSCFEDVLIQLEVGYSAKISYYLYSSSDDLEKWAGWHNWGFAIGEFDYALQVYSFEGQRMNSHETVHVIACHTIGMSDFIFLNEGLAEAVAHCHDALYSGQMQIHLTCRSLLLRDHLFPLEVLLDNSRFEDIYRSSESGYYYSQCGSLVRYLIDEYGLDRVKALIPRTLKDNCRDVFFQVYGKSIEELDEEWRDFLRNY
jgi:hypothetical protein